MWAINNHTAYKAESTWGRDKDGVHEWIVAVRATFDIDPDGNLGLADEQLEPLLAPEYHGEPGLSSLRYEADLVASKVATDIILNGTAYAPGGRPSTDFPISMRVGSVEKTLRVRGNRTWSKGSHDAAPIQPVVQVPIVYERSYGGYDRSDPDPRRHRLDPRNPVGCGLVVQPYHCVGQALPNFEYPNRDIEKAGPAGFGAIDSFWSPRRELAGTYDEAWQRERLPLLPSDWDRRSLQCAPVDQRPEGFLRGGESVELLNLTPHGRLRFVLPKIHLAYSTRIDGRVEEHRGRLSTVIIEPDVHRLGMVWQTSLRCRSDVDYLDRTVVREKAFLS